MCTIVQQFAADSGASFGKIYSANQGAIQIFGSDGNDESELYSKPMKTKSASSALSRLN